MDMQHPLVNDPVCEQAILCILLTIDTLYPDAAEIISPKMFYDQRNGIVFKAISTIYGQGEKPTIINVGQWLAANEPKSGADIALLLQLVGIYHDSSNIRSYCLRLRDLWQRRELWYIGQKLIRAGMAEDYALCDAKHDALEHIAEIDKDDRSHVMTASQVLDDLLVVVDGNRSGQRKKGILTGFKKLDEKGGFQRSDLVVVAAEFSQGKTSLAVDFCVNAALHGHPCAFYSTEMTNDQLMARIMATQSGISSRVIMQEALNEEQMKVFGMVEKIARPLPIYFDDTATISIERIIVSIRQLVLKHQVEMVFIDYLQVLQTNEGIGRQTEEQFFGTVARKLKNLAKELDICIVLLSQLSRDKSTTEPTLSRLRGSGQIAEAADMVLLIYRPVMYGKGYSGEHHKVRPEGTALIRLAKGRNVGTCEFICGYDAPTTHFFELSRIPSTDTPVSMPIDNDRPF